MLHVQTEILAKLHAVSPAQSHVHLLHVGVNSEQLHDAIQRINGCHRLPSVLFCPAGAHSVYELEIVSTQPSKIYSLDSAVRCTVADLA